MVGVIAKFQWDHSLGCEDWRFSANRSNGCISETTDKMYVICQIMILFDLG